MSADDIEKEIHRQAKEQLDQTLDIPDGLTEDEAVAWAIKTYQKKTGLELPEDDVRAEIRKEMAGRETT